MEWSSTPEAELITTKCQKKEFKLKGFWLSIYMKSDHYKPKNSPYFIKTHIETFKSYPILHTSESLS